MPESVFGDDWDVEQAQPGYTWKRARLGRRLGGQLLGASVFELPPGEAAFPYHLHRANEELLLVLEGAPTLRTPDGEQELRPGDLELFRRGPEGAHQVVNRSDRTARILVVSTMIEPEIGEYPDSGKVGLFAGHAPGAPSGGESELSGYFRLEPVDYFDGEPGPAPRGRPR